MRWTQSNEQTLKPDIYSLHTFFFLLCLKFGQFIHLIQIKTYVNINESSSFTHAINT